MPHFFLVTHLALGCPACLDWGEGDRYLLLMLSRQRLRHKKKKPFFHPPICVTGFTTENVLSYDFALQVSLLLYSVIDKTFSSFSKSISFAFHRAKLKYVIIHYTAAG